MKINWKVRLKNKTWLLAMSAALFAFVYQGLALLGITPAITQDQLTQIVSLVLNILVAMGVVVDPTTAGLTDSSQAMTYTEPREG